MKTITNSLRHAQILRAVCETAASYCKINTLNRFDDEYMKDVYEPKTRTRRNIATWVYVYLCVDHTILDEYEIQNQAEYTDEFENEIKEVIERVCNEKIDY